MENNESEQFFVQKAKSETKVKLISDLFGLIFAVAIIFLPLAGTGDAKSTALVCMSENVYGQYVKGFVVLIIAMLIISAFFDLIFLKSKVNKPKEYMEFLNKSTQKMGLKEAFSKYGNLYSSAVTFMLIAIIAMFCPIINAWVIVPCLALVISILFELIYIGKHNAVLGTAIELSLDYMRSNIEDDVFMQHASGIKKGYSLSIATLIFYMLFYASILFLPILKISPSANAHGTLILGCSTDLTYQMIRYSIWFFNYIGITLIFTSLTRTIMFSGNRKNIELEIYKQYNESNVISKMQLAKNRNKILVISPIIMLGADIGLAYSDFTGTGEFPINGWIAVPIIFLILTIIFRLAEKSTIKRTGKAIKATKNEVANKERESNDRAMRKNRYW